MSITLPGSCPKCDSISDGVIVLPVWGDPHYFPANYNGNKNTIIEAAGLTGKECLIHSCNVCQYEIATPTSDANDD